MTPDVSQGLNSTTASPAGSLSFTCAFGVGCFHFAPRVNDGRPFSLKHYPTQLRACLRSIDVIKDIWFSDVSLYDDTPVPVESLRDLADDPCFAQLAHAHFRYSFEVYVSCRLQAELLGRVEGSCDTHPENFRVHTHYTAFGPVSFVECPLSTTASSCLRPTIAVTIVRKYLEKSINESAKALELSCVDPSPFNADFFIHGTRAAHASGAKFDSTYEHVDGHDQVTIVSYCADSEQMDPLKAELFLTLDSELGFFYRFMRERNAKKRAWQRIQDGLELIIEPDPYLSMLGRLRAAVENRKRIRRLTHQLLAFRNARAYIASTRHEAYRKVYRRGSAKTFLKRYVDHEMRDSYKYRTTNILEMLKFEEERSKHSIHQFFVVAAALVAAILGAAMTKG